MRPKIPNPTRLRLKPADIILVESDGFVAWAIRVVSRRKGERPTRANHVAMVVGVPDLILDAQPPRVHVDPLFDTYGAEGERIGIYRYKGLTDAQRLAVAKRALKYDSDTYGFLKIVLHWLGLARWCFIDGFPICSYTVAVPFQEIVGLRFGLDANAAQPDDIDDFIQANGHLFETVRPMMPVDGER